jgi:hypothetical protein
MQVLRQEYQEGKANRPEGRTRSQDFLVGNAGLRVRHGIRVSGRCGGWYQIKARVSVRLVLLNDSLRPILLKNSEFSWA